MASPVVLLSLQVVHFNTRTRNSTTLVAPSLWPQIARWAGSRLPRRIDQFCGRNSTNNYVNFLFHCFFPTSISRNQNHSFLFTLLFPASFLSRIYFDRLNHNFD